METLDNEIHDSGNFIRDNNDTDAIYDIHSIFLKNHKLTNNNRLPFLYWTAKLHKNPSSHRFITSGRNCSTQPLSIIVGYCLKTVLNVVRSNAKYHRKLTNTNSCFIIDNRDSVISFIRRSNQIGNVHSVSTFDFKTLYTSIPHDKLKQKLATVIRLGFTSRKKRFISVTGKMAFLSDGRKSELSFSTQQLIDCVNFIVDNSFIVYKGQVFRQCIGIPMGTNCAPFLANLFLFAYEFEFINKLVHQHKFDVAYSLADSFRYQDDCLVFNDQNDFLLNWKEIYPQELELVKTNNGNVCNFLDLTIDIVDGKFTYKRYDKRQDFDFEVINYPFLGSNIPHGPSYGVFISQLIRLCEVNSNLVEFQADLELLIHKLLLQNFDAKVIKKKFKQFFSNNIIRWSKFSSDIEHILD